MPEELIGTSITREQRKLGALEQTHPRGASG